EESVSHGSKSIAPVPATESHPLAPPTVGPSLHPQKLFSALTVPSVPLYIPIALPAMRLKLPDTFAFDTGEPDEKLSTSMPTLVEPVTSFEVNPTFAAGCTYIPIPNAEPVTVLRLILALTPSAVTP